MTSAAEDPRSPLPRGLLILVGLAAATIAVAGMRSLAGLIAPAFLALVLTIMVHPVRTRLRGRGWPDWLGTIVVMVLVYAVLIALTLSLVLSVAHFAELLPQYEDEFADLLGSTEDALARLGVSDAEIDDLLSGFDIGELGGFVASLLSRLLGLVSNLFFVVSLLFFLALDGAWFPDRLRLVSTQRPSIAAALESFAHGTRTYLVVCTVFGLIVAVVDGVALWALGVPGPVLWGLLAFITNYIPNVGFVIGLVPPALLALLEGGPGLMLAVIAIYCVVNFVIQSIIQPKVMGDAVGLSTSLTFISLVFWAWVLGPLGALLAIPLTLLAKAMLVDVDRDSDWMQPLLVGPSPASRARREDDRKDAPDE